MSVATQLERVRRHYEAALPKYDKISLLDLAHSLRVVGEMKVEVQQWAINRGLSLRVPVPTPFPKPIKVSLRTAPYIYVPMMSGVPSVPVEARAMFIIPNSSHLVSAAVMQRVAKFTVTRPVAYCTNFKDWMNHWVVELGYNEPDGSRVLLQISREMMAKRVANIMGGSHPEQEQTENTNRFDEHIRNLSEIKVANGAPIPYYQLLETAKDITEQVVIPAMHTA